MRVIGQIATGTLGFILFWVPLAFSSQSLSNYNSLQDVTVERKGGDLLIQLKFKKSPIHFQDLKFFKKSVQMDFPLAYVNPSKRYFDTGDDRIRQIYVSQFDPKRLRLRLMLSPGTSILKDELTLKQVGRVLRIRVNPTALVPKLLKSEVVDPLESLLARASRIQQSKVPQTRTISGQLVKQKPPKDPQRGSSPVKEEKTNTSTRKIDDKITPLSQILGQGLKSEQPQQESSSEPLVLKTKKAGLLDFEEDLSVEKPDLFSASLKMVYTLGLVLGLMFVIFHLFKKFGLKNSVFGGENKPIQVLSTGFLAPRKSIALVEVAGDVLVVGISNDQISLLGNIQDPEKIDHIKNSLKKKGQECQPIDSSSMANEAKKTSQDVKVEEKTNAEKQGVDVYKKRLIKPGSTNLFGEYVRQFTDSSNIEQPEMKNVPKRVNKNPGEVPVFK